MCFWRISLPTPLSTLALALSLLAPPCLAQEPPSLPEGAPTFEQVISLRRASQPAISEDGRLIAFEVRSADWTKNRFDVEIWLVREGEEPFQLTRTTEGSSTSPRFSPDGRWLGFLADRGDGRQIHLIRTAGGEAQKLTEGKEGISDFRFSPDGKTLVFLRTEPEGEARVERKERYGEYAVEDAESRPAHLWRVDVVVDPRPAPAEMPCPKKKKDDEKSDGEDDACPGLPKPRQLTKGEEFTVESFDLSPDGRQIVFERRKSPLITDYVTADLALLDVASGEARALYEAPGPDGSPRFSPDGRSVLFASTGGDTASDFYKNGQILVIPTAGGEPRRLAADFDEDPSELEWTPAGIFFLGWQGTKRQVFRIDPESGRAEPFLTRPETISGYAVTPDGMRFALRGVTSETLGEIYRFDPGSSEPRLVTAMSEQIAGWALGTRELVSWPSQDGTTIEGVLHKPPGFDPARRYPLMVVIHGGPTGIDVPEPLPGYVYPIAQWLAKGALVLRPNYRGSAGYGEAFRSLNVRNLGVGDAWDVLSGVDALIARGWIDPERVAAMGWSQGGYISAYLTTTSERFRAISVGAGISNWMTYYVNTDIHPFTRQYLEATPWDDPEIYARTSPMTFIKKARTPTLIQHGENDRRVPIPNAYELYQGLLDQGVEAKLVVYKGFGHGIDKPKELLAAVTHNWEWFARHLWGEEKSP